MEFLPKGQATLTAWWRGGRWDGSSQLGGEGMEVLPGKIVERILGREEGGRKGDSGFHLGEEVYGPPRPSFHVDGEREPGTRALSVHVPIFALRPWTPLITLWRIMENSGSVYQAHWGQV